MNHLRQHTWILIVLAAFCTGSRSQAQDTLAAKPKAALDPIEVLTRGPIHEAFAAPINQQPTEPTPVKKAPPPPIKEEPPQERPDLDNAKWIPGYWAWDAERQDYMWVTGVYRAAPQGRSYVPGYWENSAQGYRWIAGFWSNDKSQNLTYAPEPPAPLAVGPKTQAPNDNSLYIPGSWVFSNDRFIWRDGYWTAAQAGRVWVPSQYVWTPNGYVYVDGYWDAPYDGRGLAYAPIYFNQPLYQNPNWSFQPNYLINPGAFFNSAFTNRNSYYFGNYYNPLYAQLGFSPWYAGNGRYDPLFSYYGWQNYRNNPNWIANTQQLYASRTAGQGTLPPTTLAQQNAFVAANRGGFVPVVSTPAQFHSNHFRLAQASPTQLDAQRANSVHMREIAGNRQRLETTAARQVSLGNMPAAANRTLSMHQVMGGAAPHATNQPIWHNLNTNTQHSIAQPHMMTQPHIMHTAPIHQAAPIHYAAPVHHAAPAMHGGGGGHRR